jgi:hypothetical protein
MEAATKATRNLNGTIQATGEDEAYNYCKVFANQSVGLVTSTLPGWDEDPAPLFSARTEYAEDVRVTRCLLVATYWVDPKDQNRPTVEDRDRMPCAETDYHTISPEKSATHSSPRAIRIGSRTCVRNMCSQSTRITLNTSISSGQRMDSFSPLLVAIVASL